MPTQITGFLGSPDPSGVLLPLGLATLYVSPSQSREIRIQYGGTGEFIVVTANTALPAQYQYGFATITDSNGQYDFMLPLDTEIHTPDLASFRWNLTLPDGSVYTGPPLSAAGPYTLDDLVESQGWALSSSLYVQTSVLGQVAQGTVTMTGQQSVQVGFTQAMPDGSFQVVCSPGADSVTGDVPTYSITNKTGQGFLVELSFSFTGTMDFIAWHA